MKYSLRATENCTMDKKTVDDLVDKLKTGFYAYPQLLNKLNTAATSSLNTDVSKTIV